MKRRHQMNRELKLREASGEDVKIEMSDGYRVRVVPNLPHLYGYKWYPWARAFFDSTAKMCLLCAANQISKSSTQIRKCIDWATNKKKWKKLWPPVNGISRTPRIFWYMYPSKDVATIEWRSKWVPEFMPRAHMKEDPVYGWEEVYEGKNISHIIFKSGIIVYFKTYTQRADNLQTSTVDAVFTDEELPEEKYDEIRARLFASDGYFSMVFTATLNQDMWRRALEGKGENELFKDAFKLQISMYDCLRYDDGTPSPWTPERIAEIIRACKSKLEVERRVHGRFVTEVGRKYGGFDSSRHFIAPQPIPQNWRWYVGIDSGSGGGAHKAAVVFVAVRPDLQLGYVARGWRGDGVITTAGDTFDKFKELKGTLQTTNQRYDPSAKDFSIIASRNGEGFEKADRSHETGESVVNTLFQSDMLFIFDTAELRKLGSELSSVMKNVHKSHAKDDFCDALRYCVTTIPWDWTAIKGGTQDEVLHDEFGPLPNSEPLKIWSSEEYEADQIRRRRGEEEYVPDRDGEGWGDLLEDIEEANENYG
jgi:hypothetical protein